MTPLALPGLGVAFAAPWGLALGAGAAAALVALHAITVGRPRPVWLPTARFAPERPPRAARRLRRPTDRRLLALRAGAALLAGAAVARPVPLPERRAVRRVVLADRSRAADPAAVRAAVLDVARPGDVLVPFDAAPGAPVALPAAPADTGAALRRQVDSALAATRGAGAGDVGGVGSLSAALVAARRLAPALAPGADSLELVVVSPLAAEEADAATPLVRAAWGGRARVVRVAARPADPAAAAAAAAAAMGSAAGARGARARRPVTASAVALRGAPPDDAVAAALALAGVPGGGDEAMVRVVRGRATDADRAWARGAAGRVLVDWPADGVPAGARAAAADTAHALVTEAGAGAPAGAAVAVAPFVRRAALDPAPADARVVARWGDGRPAAVERRDGGGCVRQVAVAVPQVGDAALRGGFRALLPALLGPCGGRRDLAPLPAASVAMLAGRGPLLAAAPLRAALAPPAPDRLGAALLALAALALAAELVLRRRLRAHPEADDAAAPAAPTDVATGRGDAPAPARAA